jgi:hypothetical protein
MPADRQANLSEALKPRSEPVARLAREVDTDQPCPVVGSEQPDGHSHSPVVDRVDQPEALRRGEERARSDQLAAIALHAQEQLSVADLAARELEDRM